MDARSHDFWGEFALDPRHHEHASLRAGDRDREIVQAMLGEAYAHGRISREEHDERVEYAAGCRILGDLPPVLADLVQQSPVHVVPHAQLRRQAEWRADATIRRARVPAAAMAVLATLVLLAALVGPGGNAVVAAMLPWTVAIILTLRAVALGRRREELVTREHQRLEWQVRDRLERQQRALRRQQRRQGPGYELGRRAGREVARRIQRELARQRDQRR